MPKPTKAQRLKDGQEYDRQVYEYIQHKYNVDLNRVMSRENAVKIAGILVMGFHFKDTIEATAENLYNVATKLGLTNQ